MQYAGALSVYCVHIHYYTVLQPPFLGVVGSNIPARGKKKIVETPGLDPFLTLERDVGTAYAPDALQY